MSFLFLWKSKRGEAVGILDIRLPILFAFLLGNFVGKAQGTYQFGLLPSININKNLGKGWGLNARWEARNLLKKGTFGSEAPLDFSYVLSDFSVIVSKKVGLSNSLAGGYFVRFQENTVVHRAIQQFSMVRKYSGFRLAHRFASDQGFARQKDPTFRLRYRITPEIPLNGQTIDPKECYFKLNHEYLNAFQGRKYDLEIRVVPLLGYAFSDGNKLEVGLDYRINSFLADAANHSVWVSLGWFVKL